jgi:Na+/H+-dicarboxylate symporter
VAEALGVKLTLAVVVVTPLTATPVGAAHVAVAWVVNVWHTLVAVGVPQMPVTHMVYCVFGSRPVMVTGDEVAGGVMVMGEPPAGVYVI